MISSNSIETQLASCLQGIERHRRREAYAILGQGMWLLNAAAVYALPPDGRHQGRKSIPTVGIDLAKGNEGFVQWLRENVTGPETALRLSLATCYNYMKAAQAMGLKAGDGEEELRALEEADALAGRRISDLYKPLPAPGAGDGPPAPPPGGPEQMWLPFRAELSLLFEPDSKSRLALHAMPLPELEGLEEQLRFGLDAIREIKATKTTKGGRRTA